MKQFFFTIVAFGLLLVVGNHFDWDLKGIPNNIVGLISAPEDVPQNGPQDHHTQDLIAKKEPVISELAVQEEKLAELKVKTDGIKAQSDSLAKLIIDAELAKKDTLRWDEKAFTLEQAKKQLINYLKLLAILEDERDLRQSVIADLENAIEELCFRIVKTEQAISIANAREVTAGLNGIFEENSRVLAEVFHVVEKSESLVKTTDMLYRELDSPKVSSRSSVDVDVEAFLDEYRPVEGTAEGFDGHLADDIMNIVSVINAAK